MKLDTAAVPSGAELDYYGLALNILPSDLPDDRVFSTVEPDMARIMTQVLRRGDRVLCGGLGCGSTSALAALICGNERVWTVEPIDELREIVTANVAVRGQPLQLLAGALGRSEGHGPFWQAPWYGMSSLRKRDDDAVEMCVRLHNTARLIEELDITALVLDVEGAEAEIIPSLPHARLRVLIAELHEGYDPTPLLRMLVHEYQQVMLHICHGPAGMAVVASRPGLTG